MQGLFSQTAARLLFLKRHQENLLPNNLLFASLFLLGWLLFTPSSWRCYISLIDSKLPADFAFADLNKKHWQNHDFRRLIYLGHGIWPIWTALFVALILWLLDIEGSTIILTTSYAFIFSIISGLLGSFTISAAFGMITGSIGGILLSMPIGLSGDIIFSMAENIAIAVMLNLGGDFQAPVLENDLYALLTVLLGIFTASQAGSVMYRASTHFNYSQNLTGANRQIGSIVLGVLISSGAVFLMTKFISILAHSAATLMESGILFSLVYDTLISVAFGLSLLFIWGWQTARWKQSLLLGIALSVTFSLFSFIINRLNEHAFLNELIAGLHGGVENALLFVLLFAFPYVLARRIANPWTGIIAGIFGSAGTYITFSVIMGQYSLQFILILVTFVFFLGFTVPLWRPLLFYPFLSAWNLLLYRADEKRLDHSNSLIRWHSAFWDEYQYLPLFGLENYLVMVAERNPLEGQKALEYLSTSPQSWAARAAQIELDARRLESCIDVNRISKAYRRLAAGELTGPASALLRSFSRLSRDVEAALSQESFYNQRLALDAVEERLDGLLRELTRSSEPYALRFRPIAGRWRQILAGYTKTLSEAVESRQEINNPYIIGIPLTEHQEIFVGRSDVSEHIEQLLLDYRCPPLLLYGQRRTGKTSLLNNLGRLLPSTLIPLFVDLQGPTSLAKDYEGFLYNLSRAMRASAKRHRELILPPLARADLEADPFTCFDEWLDEIENKLSPKQTVLLTLDEFSALEHIFNKGYLDEASVLGMFRHLIQHRPRFKILLSGSHTLDEFERWASYLINVQTVHLSYLQASEALQLIEQPVQDFRLRYDYAASQRVMQITRCHPALIQLLCAEIVTLKNKQNIMERRLAILDDVESAIPGALQHGRFFFADITNNQISRKGVELLCFLAKQGEGYIISEESICARNLNQENCKQVLSNLLHRELIEELGGGYRFQVELIRCWFASIDYEL